MQPPLINGSSSWNGSDVSSDNTSFSSDSFSFDILDTINSLPKRRHEEQDVERAALSESYENGEPHFNRYLERQSLEESQLRNRNLIQKRLLLIIALHLLLVCMAEIATLLCAVYMFHLDVDVITLYEIEEGIVVFFPCVILIVLAAFSLFRSTFISWLLFISYSFIFAIFLCSVCDLLFGIRFVYGYVTVILLTLSVSLFLFSRYSSTENPTRYNYALFMLIILVISAGLSLGLILLNASAYFPHILNGIFRKDRDLLSADSDSISGAAEDAIPDEQILMTTEKSLLWSSHIMAIFSTFVALLLGTLLMAVARRLVFSPPEIHPASRTEEDLPVVLLAFRALVTVEVFFVTLPIAGLSKLKSICDDNTEDG